MTESAINMPSCWLGNPECAVLRDSPLDKKVFRTHFPLDVTSRNVNSGRDTHRRTESTNFVGVSGEVARFALNTAMFRAGGKLCETKFCTNRYGVISQKNRIWAKLFEGWKHNHLYCLRSGHQALRDVCGEKMGMLS